MPAGSSACSSSRALSSRSAAVSSAGSVKSVVAGEVRESSVTFPALRRLLPATRALVFVRTTLVASAPAPATPTLKPLARLTDRATLLDETRMAAFSRAVRVMSPAVLTTPSLLLVIAAVTEFFTVLRAMLAAIERVRPPSLLAAAIVTAPTSASIVEVSIAARTTVDPVIPPAAALSMLAAALSMLAITVISTLLMALAPDPPPAIPLPLANAIAPASTKASTDCSAPAVTDIGPPALTLEPVSVAAVVPDISFVVSEAPIATEKAAPLPRDAANETAATVAWILAVFSAVSVRPPLVPSLLESTVAFVSPPIVLIASAPPPVKAMLVSPSAIEIDALMQYALIVLSWDAVRLMLDGAVAPVATLSIDAPTFAMTVLVALLTAIARARLASPAFFERAIVPPIA